MARLFSGAVGRLTKGTAGKHRNDSSEDGIRGMVKVQVKLVVVCRDHTADDPRIVAEQEGSGSPANPSISCSAREKQHLELTRRWQPRS